MCSDVQTTEERDISFFGAAFASDESPPNGNRFAGLRFQVTWAYILWFLPEARWEDPAFDDAYPFIRESKLCDVVHCSSKLGPHVLHVICQQLERIGIFKDDLVNGVGDGGGENEGTQGVHRLLEINTPSYCRRRCLPHFAWRTFAAGTAEMEPHFAKMSALNSYLRRGVTWSRLKAIAIKSEVEGGSGLGWTEHAPEFVRFFSSSPPKMMDERPEATVEFMEWLLPRQFTLRQLVDADLRSRFLDGTEARDGQATLQSRRECIYRHVDYIMMKKAMFLFYWTKGKDRGNKLAGLFLLHASCGLGYLMSMPANLLP